MITGNLLLLGRHARKLTPYPSLCGGGALAQRVAGTTCRVRRGVSGIQIDCDESR